MQRSRRTRRPVGVSFLAFLGVTSGALGLIGAVLALVNASVASGLLFLLLSLLSLAFGVGAWLLKRWAWFLGLVIFGMRLVEGLIGLAGDQPLAGQLVIVVISAAVLFYLFTPPVRSAFS